VDVPSLTAALKQNALLLGFDLAEAVPVAVFNADLSCLEHWLDLGRAGEMRYFVERLDAYRDPNRVLDGVKSVLMLGMNYRTVEPAELHAGQGRVSRFAWGLDYHDLVHERLRNLADYFRELVPSGNARGIVDTAPFLERSFAARAGLGWIGENTALISPKFGSWLFLAALLTTEELDYSSYRQEPRPPGILDFELKGSSPCANCHACLDACPTGALVAPYQLDARKCISYLTIEHRGEVPAEFKSKIGDRLFGCDACQEACPWNRHTPSTTEEAFYPREGMNPIDLVEIQNLDEESFRRRFRGTPLWRAKLKGLQRNAAIVQANHHCE
jgi:epoxyqueuosine reductase